MIKLGIAINNIGASQMSFWAISRANQLLQDNRDMSVTIYYENMHKPCIQPQFTILQMSEAWEFNGTLISTSLSSTQKAIVLPGPKKKLFYMWDLEWLRGTNTYHYEHLAAIYQNPEIQIVARSEDHERAIEEAWNVDVIGIVDDFNMEQILELC